MRLMSSLAGVSALALLAAETGAGSGSSSPPPAPSPEELAAEVARVAAVEKIAEIRAETEQALAEADQLVKDAEVARVAAVEKLAEIRTETEQVLAEADQLVKDAQAAKAKAAEEKAAADKEIREAVKTKGQATKDKAAAEAAVAQAKLAQQKADQAEASRSAAELGEVVEVPAYDGPRQAIVWAAPGHAMLAVGVLVSVPAAEAEALRGAGRARFALDEEVAALGDQVPELAGL